MVSKGHWQDFRVVFTVVILGLGCRAWPAACLMRKAVISISNIFNVASAVLSIYWNGASLCLGVNWDDYFFFFFFFERPAFHNLNYQKQHDEIPRSLSINCLVRHSTRSAFSEILQRDVGSIISSICGVEWASINYRTVCPTKDSILGNYAQCTYWPVH